LPCCACERMVETVRTRMSNDQQDLHRQTLSATAIPARE
jgi:hypothetical protein